MPCTQRGGDVGVDIQGTFSPILHFTIYKYISIINTYYKENKKQNKPLGWEELCQPRIDILNIKKSPQLNTGNKTEQLFHDTGNANGQ